MRYLMVGEEWKNKENVYVDVKITPKSIVITPLSPKPIYTNGCIDDLWNDGKIIIRQLKAGGRQKVTRHLLQDWSNGELTFYPHRAGIPYVLIPKDEKYKKGEKICL